MKIRRIIRKSLVVIALAATTLTTSCNEWLNVKPSNQEAAEELFSTEDGFKSALSGIYTAMVDTKLYGTEVTFAAVSVLGGEYNVTGQFHEHLTMSKYDFEDGDAVAKFDNIWKQAFFTIANINDLLAFIDVNKNVFRSEEAYSMVKGEALALRAYIHFDMLRLYSPYTFTGVNTDVATLPYVKEFDRNTTLSITNEKFMEALMKDINDAIELLKLDPIYTSKEMDDLYFKNRHYHLNYYGAVALKARMALYGNNKTEAKTAAMEVINAQQNKGLFPWITSEAISTTNDAERDRTFSTEHIFALNVRNMLEIIGGYFISPTTDKQLPLIDASFDGVTTDYRAQFVNAESYTTKFNQPEETTGVDNIHMLRRMPMIRISEMYYIVAECDDDMSYVKTVSNNRGIVDDLTVGKTVVQALQAEYKKEFIGEGQLFYFYKRQNSADIGGNTDVKYVIPMPQDEIDFGGRPRPQ